MASIGPLHSCAESSIILHTKNYRRPKFTFFAYWPRRSLDFGDVNVRSLGCSRVVGEDNGMFSFFGGCSREQKRRFKPVKAKGGGEGETDAADEPQDALQASIEKNKKVLAMQKELLEQIAERRKLVSSIKSSMIETEGDRLPDKEENGSIPDPNTGSTLGGDSDVLFNDILSTSYVQSTEGGLEEKHLPFISRNLVEDLNGRGKDLFQNQTPASADPHNSLTTSTQKIFQSDEIPRDLSTYSSLPKTSSTSDSKSDASGTVNPSRSDDVEVESQKISQDASRVKVHPGIPSFFSKSISSPKYEKHEDINESYPDEAGIEDPADKNVKPPPLAGANVMNIILVAAECAPWSKTGGLGDVAGALPKALARRGHRVMVVAPLYGNYAEPQHTGVRKVYKVDGQDMEVTFSQAYIDGVDFVFIESPIFRHIENNIYGGNHVDILKRVILFCKAAVEVPWHVPCGGVCYGDGNLIFIANDWHTALLPVYLKAYYRDQGLMQYTRSVLVIHNIAHQGRGPVDDFSYVDLPPHYLDLFRLYDPVGGEHFNIFAAGLKSADRVVTVSHGYAWELKTSEGGWGLHGIINESDWKFSGIVNGIDTKEWSPGLDVHLQSDGYTNYSLDNLQTGKAKCKAALQKELGLPIRDDVPLIGFIGRLDQQKGVDLIAEAVPWMMGQDVQLVMLGTGRPDLEQMLRQLEGQHHDKARGWVGFSVKTAHRITAGADILLMPSRFEPCGLNQLYAMRYGTIPVVHAVGGLRDTVQPFNPFNESGLGWTFGRAEANQLINALGNCLLTYRQYKNSWEGLQRRGMTQDLSWDSAAEKYEEVLVAAKYQW